MKPSIITFDLDGTLIRNTNTMELACGLNGRFDDCVRVQNQISIEKTVDWVVGDYIRAEFMKGADMRKLDSWFDSHVRIISGLAQLLEKVIELGITPILVTTGPQQVAECMKRRFPFAAAYGSIYEEENGFMTGKITKHLFYHGGKYGCLKDYCREYGLDERFSVAVGDSYSDKEVFERAARSIAINYTDDLEGHADAYFRTENIMDIYSALIEEF